jgi:hypothetical protein
MTGVLRYYLDTEFYEDGKTIDLISIGIVCEDGREFYAANSDAELHRVSPWVRDNVLPHLSTYGSPEWKTRAEIRDSVVAFIAPVDEYSPKTQVWGYYADYDWVVFCQLFGTMMDLPKYMPKYCMDLKQLAVERGDPRLPKQEKDEHHALMDARWNKRAHAFLMMHVAETQR